MMMLLTAFIIPHMGSGPFWAMRMWTEADKCKKYWWTNFLAISNFIDVENQVNICYLVNYPVIAIILAKILTLVINFFQYGFKSK